MIRIRINHKQFAEKNVFLKIRCSKDIFPFLFILHITMNKKDRKQYNIHSKFSEVKDKILENLLFHMFYLGVGHYLCRSTYKKKSGDAKKSLRDAKKLKANIHVCLF